MTHEHAWSLWLKELTDALAIVGGWMAYVAEARTGSATYAMISIRDMTSSLGRKMNRMKGYMLSLLRIWFSG